LLLETQFERTETGSKLPRTHMRPACRSSAGGRMGAIPPTCPAARHPLAPCFSAELFQTQARIRKRIMGYRAREALFISHASPEDNAFSLWLGAKLTALGYEVFADVLRLRGSDDWERILEAPFAIRPPSFSWLQHLTGCRSRVYDQFIVPLRLAPLRCTASNRACPIHRFFQRLGTGLERASFAPDGT